MSVLCMKCGGDILAPPALCGNCASAIPPREPTEAMMSAGGRSIINGQETRPGSSWADEAGLAWRAMYDAALAEREGK